MPRLHGLDWASMDGMFADCLFIRPQPDESSSNGDQRTVDLIEDEDDGDVALMNLVGDGAADLAEKWAENGKFRKKLDILRRYLGAEKKRIVDRFLGVDEQDDAKQPVTPNVWKGKGRAYYRESDDETDYGDSDDERGRTAHRLFAGLAGIEDKEKEWWMSSSQSSSQSQVLEDAGVVTSKDARVLGEATGMERAGDEHLSGALPHGMDRLTPESSAVRPGHGRHPNQNKITDKGKKRKMDSPPHTPPRPPKRAALQHSTMSRTSPIRLPRLRPAPKPPQRVSSAGHTKTAEVEDRGMRAPLASTSRRSDQLELPSAARPLMDVNNYLVGRSMSSSPCTSNTDDTPKESKNGKFGKIQVIPSGENEQLSPRFSTNHDCGKSPTHVLPAEHSTSRRPQDYSHPNERPTLPLQRPRGPKPSSTSMLARSEPPTGLSLIAPQSPDRHRKQKLSRRAQQLQIAERLARAWPERVAPSYEAKRKRLLSRSIAADTKEQYRAGMRASMASSMHPQSPGMVFSLETVDDDDGGMDWERSRELAEGLRADIASGRRPTLPPLMCAESQSEELNLNFSAKNTVINTASTLNVER